MTSRLYLAIAVLLLASTVVRAQTVTIIHAKAWTMTSPTAIDDATVVVRDGKIESVSAGAQAAAGGRTIDARGGTLTPGLFHAATHLGLVEVSSASDTVSLSTKSPALGAAFDVQYALDSNSSLIGMARADGVTRAVTYPVASGVVPFAGQGALLRLLDSANLLEQSRVGVFAVIGSTRAGANESRAAQWALLRMALDSVRTELRSRQTNGAPSAERQALASVLTGKQPLVVSTNRESDLRQAAQLATDYSIRVVIIGGAEAWRAADVLAAAGVAVILDPQVNLPSTFDELGARLDNAALLEHAGVKIAVIVIESGIQQSYNAGLSMREGAGLAVANGLPYIEGLRAITSGPAEIWGVSDRFGTLAPGKDADLVIWDGDPLEPSTLPVVVLVGGAEVSLATRQTELRDRYSPPPLSGDRR